jgi:plastocyanin
MRVRHLSAAVLALLVATGLSTAASGQPARRATRTARDWVVWAGPTGFLKRPPAGAPKSSSADLFFPESITINAGDTLTIKTREGHTATVLGSAKPSYFSFFKTQGTYAETPDSTGTPFWFGGKPKWVYTAGKLFVPIGNTVIGDRTTLHSRTILAPDPHNPPGIKSSVTYSFPNPGTYTIVCIFHWPVMKLHVVVKPAGAPVPGQAAVQTAMLQEVTSAVATAKTLTTTTPPPKTVWAGATKNGVDMIQFFPAKVTVPVGGAVTLAAHSIVENHNIVFGSPKNPWIHKYLSSSDQFPTGQVAPEEVYGTDPPSTGYDGTNHGNGFFVTRVVDHTSLTPQIGTTTRITFTKAGTYHYFCEIHGPDMSGDIVVTP